MSTVQKKKKAKKGGMLKKVVLLVLLVGIVGGAYFAWQYYQKIYAPHVTIADGDDGYLYIPSNADYAEVEQLLLKKGFIKNANNFSWVAEKKNFKGANIVSGKYKLEQGMSNNDLIDHLRAGNGRLEVTVQFGQVRTLEELAGKLGENIEADSLDIINWMHNSDSLNKFGFNKATFPAFFIPNSYQMDWSTTTPELMRRMAKEFKSFWTTERKQKAKDMGMSQSEVVTLASIVYWETKLPEDMPRVAGVYYNRIKVGMPLQADPTLIYAIGDFSIRRVLNKHKEFDSPYNTYKYAGLPPGPILIPPTSFVDASLNYEKHDYYYFCASEALDGTTNFAKSYQQHLVNARKFQKALNERGIYK